MDRESARGLRSRPACWLFPGNAGSISRPGCGGALAVFFYRRDSGLLLPPALAARIGGAAGVVAVAIQSFFFTLWIFVFHHQQEYIDSVTRFVHSVGADASIPDIQASIRSLFTPAG